jgi:hypothetical protein
MLDIDFTIIKKYFIIIFLLLLIIFFIYYKYIEKIIFPNKYNENYKNYKNKNKNKEGFTGSLNSNQFKSEPRPINNDTLFPDNFLQPIVLTNTKEYPIIKFGSLSNGTLSNTLLNYFQKKIYPFTKINYNNINIILEQLLSNTIDLAFIREYNYLKYIKNYNLQKKITNYNNSSNNYNKFNNIKAICSLYYEYVICMATKDSLEYFNTSNKHKYLIEIRNKPQECFLGVLEHDYIYLNKVLDYLNFDIVLEQSSNNKNNLKIIKKVKRNNLIIYIYSNNKNLFQDYSNNNLNLIFGLWHPKNTYIQNVCKEQQNYLINILPNDKLPLEIDIDQYNTINKETTNKIQEFIQLFKNEFMWSYKHILNSFMFPNIINFNIAGYTTFKIRNILLLNTNFYNKHNYKLSNKHIEKRNEIIQTITKNIINNIDNTILDNDLSDKTILYNNEIKKIEKISTTVINSNMLKNKKNMLLDMLNEWNIFDDLNKIKTNNLFIQNNDEDNFKFDELLTFSKQIEIDDNAKIVFKEYTQLLKEIKINSCYT